MQMSQTFSLVSMAALLSASFCLIGSVQHQPWSPGNETWGPGDVLDCSNHFVLQRVTDTTHGRYYQDTVLPTSEVSPQLALRTVLLPKPVEVAPDVTGFQYAWSDDVRAATRSQPQRLTGQI
ncbi:uncharacterized protein [Branchiostoma lanceolatum]|uniref:uncharacterized protein n=1 Tax=Branchiostoma lanceolatum TaxID=7740 RepID=UPI003451BFB2